MTNTFVLAEKPSVTVTPDFMLWLRHLGDSLGGPDVNSSAEGTVKEVYVTVT